MIKIDLKKSIAIIILAGIVVIAWKIDWTQSLLHLYKMGWQILWLFPISGMAYFFATIAWYFCLGTDVKDLKISELFMVRHIGETLSLVNPTSVLAGDGAKYLLLKKLNIKDEVNLASILLSRVIIIISALALISISCIYLVGYYLEITHPWMLATGMLIILGIFKYLLWNFFTGRGMNMYSAGNKLLFFGKNSPWRVKLLDSIYKSNLASIEYVVKHPYRLYIAYLFSLLHWLVGAIEIYFILWALGISIPALSAVSIEMGVAFIKNLVAFIPGQVGVEEIGNKMMIALVGISSPIVWVTVSLMRRLRQLIWILIGGVFFSMR